jgi:cytochrome c oxidase cbb3-type subunit III
MKRFLSILTALLLCSNLLMAQNATTPAAEPQSNFLEIFMAVIAVVLVFVIWGLSNILTTFARQVFEKQKQSGGKTAAMIVSMLFLSAASYAQEAADAAQKTATTYNYGGLSATSFWLLAGVIITEFIVIFVLVFNIQRLHKELQPAAEKALAPAEAKAESESGLLRTWRYLDQKFFTKAAQKEADVMLDHDYDGIRELDNALPPWWKYGFYITIFLAVVYLLRFHVWGDGPSPEQEYTAEMNRAHEQIQAYMAKAKDNVDENNVTLSDANGIEAGKALYMKTCVACHGQKGEGGVGPNLTDDYWLHGGSVSNIFKTIKYGYPDKGMQAWQTQYSPVQMQHLSSFIKSLRGTKPANAKAAQGDLYQEENNQPKADSTAAKDAKQVVMN